MLEPDLSKFGSKRCAAPSFSTTLNYQMVVMIAKMEKLLSRG